MSSEGPKQSGQREAAQTLNFPRRLNPVDNLANAESLNPESCDAGSFCETIANYERVVVFIGRMGVGKTSIFGNFCGRSDLHKLSPTSQTEGVICNDFSETYVLNGKRVAISFKCYDTEGFTGDVKKDIHILHRLLNIIRKSLPKIHVIFFCVSANRFTNDDRSILQMIVRHGGKELASRLKYILTNAPKRLATQELIDDCRHELIKITGRDVPSTDIIASDLLDPNQFDEGTPLRQGAMDYWAETKQRLHRVVRNIPTESSFHLDNISAVSKGLSLVTVYWVPVVLGILGVAILLLLVGVIHRQVEIDSILRANATLKAEMDKLMQARYTPESSSSGSFAMSFVSKVGSGVQEATKTFIGGALGAWELMMSIK